MMIDAFTNWKKSSRSGGSNQCVECAVADGLLAVRDSKSPDGPRLIFPARAAVALIACAKQGDYDI